MSVSVTGSSLLSKHEKEIWWRNPERYNKLLRRQFLGTKTGFERGFYTLKGLWLCVENAFQSHI